MIKQQGCFECAAWPDKGPGIVIEAFSQSFSGQRRDRVGGIAAAVGRLITNRYPQIEVPGFYDGPGLSAARPGNRALAFLARQECREALSHLGNVEK